MNSTRDPEKVTERSMDEHRNCHCAELERNGRLELEAWQRPLVCDFVRAQIEATERFADLLPALIDYTDDPFVDELPDGDGKEHVACGVCGDTTEGCENHGCPMPAIRKAAASREVPKT